MLAGHPQICLFQPEIPQNTGAIARLAAGAACRLHLIRPFGFDADDKQVRRPGLDYWPFLDLEIHDHLDDLLERFPGRVAFYSKKGGRSYGETPADTQLLVFGRETTGLPTLLHERFADAMYRIPLYHSGVRSLNLANAVAIVVYHHLHRKKSP